MIRICKHENLSLPRARIAKNGSIQYRRQCKTCGRPVGNVYPKRESLGILDGNFDEELLRIRLIDMTDWWEWYDEYTKTEEWALLRQQVKLRCDNICEKCGVAKVEVIHHISYERVGNENLEDLLGLCDICHQNEHKYTVIYMDNFQAP